MTITETRRQLQIRQGNGLHLRLAAQFARVASHFESEVAVLSYDQVANGKSALDLLGLAASRGDWLDLEARGADADVAIEALSELVASWRSDE